MIRLRLDYMLVERKMMLKDLSAKTGIAMNNLSIWKTNQARSLRLSTLNKICKALDCNPGDLLEYIPDEKVEKMIREVIDDL
ncbi:MAG: helix-turn-helix domain-containing protein [Planctomycetota bacterium]